MCVNVTGAVETHLPRWLSKLGGESATSAVPCTLGSDHTLGLEVGSTRRLRCYYFHYDKVKLS